MESTLAGWERILFSLTTAAKPVVKLDAMPSISAATSAPSIEPIPPMPPISADADRLVQASGNVTLQFVQRGLQLEGARDAGRTVVKDGQRKLMGANEAPDVGGIGVDDHAHGARGWYEALLVPGRGTV